MSARQDTGKDLNHKRVPDNFEDDEDDVGDVEENLGSGPRGRPGPMGGYQTATSENPNRGMQMDSRGSQKRASSRKNIKNVLTSYREEEK